MIDKNFLNTIDSPYIYIGRSKSNIDDPKTNPLKIIEFNQSDSIFQQKPVPEKLNQTLKWPLFTFFKSDKEHYYISGGLDKSPLSVKSHFSVYNPTADPTSPDSYRILPDMPTPKSSHTMVERQNYLYVIGGASEETIQKIQIGILETSSKCERYNLTSETWEVLPDLKTPRIRHGCIVLGDKIYTFGGFENEIKRTATIECLDVNCQNWEYLALKLWAPLDLTSCFVYKDNQVVIVGGNVDGYDMNGVYVIDFNLETV